MCGKTHKSESSRLNFVRQKPLAAMVGMKGHDNLYVRIHFWKNFPHLRCILIRSVELSLVFGLFANTYNSRAKRSTQTRMDIVNRPMMVPAWLQAWGRSIGHKGKLKISSSLDLFKAGKLQRLGLSFHGLFACCIPALCKK